jgi:negative regulator of genetic competence, sporulation and motility
MKFLVYKTSDKHMTTKDYSLQFELLKHCEEKDFTEEVSIYSINFDTIEDLINWVKRENRIIIHKKPLYPYDSYTLGFDFTIFSGYIEIYDYYRE